MLNDDFVIFSPNFLNTVSSKTSQELKIEISIHSVLTYAIWWDFFLKKSDDNFPLKDNFTYYVYSHHSGGIIGEHCATDVMLYTHVRVETMGVIAN